MNIINIMKVMLACNILKEIGGGGSRQLCMADYGGLSVACRS